MELISRATAKANGLPRFFTGIPCKNGHLSERNTKGNYCLACNMCSVSKYKKRTGYSLPPEYFSAWRQGNKDKTRAYDKRRSNSYTAEKAARRRAATPQFLSLLDKQKIKQIYELARDCSVITGEPYEVDHVVPINGKIVCGLHVPWNLQVIPAYQNRKKRNDFNGESI